MPAYRFIKITQSISTKRISAPILGPKTKESVDDYILLTQLQPESLLDVRVFEFLKNRRGQCFVWPIIEDAR